MMTSPYAIAYENFIIIALVDHNERHLTIMCWVLISYYICTRPTFGFVFGFQLDSLEKYLLPLQYDSNRGNIILKSVPSDRENRVELQLGLQVKKWFF